MGILSPVNIVLTCHFKIHFNIICAYPPWFSNWSLKKGLCPHFSDVAFCQNEIKLKNSVAKLPPSSTESSVPQSAAGAVRLKFGMESPPFVWSSPYSGSDEDSGLPKCDPFSLGKPFATIQKIMAPIFPRVKMSSWMRHDPSKRRDPVASHDPCVAPKKET